ncbi:hypothetical protein ACC703_37185, partial [Rhizobium ruizarguesonis]
YSAMKSARALGFATSCQLHHLLGRDQHTPRLQAQLHFTKMFMGMSQASARTTRQMIADHLTSSE